MSADGALGPLFRRVGLARGRLPAGDAHRRGKIKREGSRVVAAVVPRAGPGGRWDPGENRARRLDVFPL